MKKVTRDGKPILVPRSINNIAVYNSDGKTISTTFNYEDWSDICVGLNRKIRELRKERRVYPGRSTYVKPAISVSVNNISFDRLLRVAILALRVLVPSRQTFYLNYMMIYGQDYNEQTAPFKTFDEMLQRANRDLVKKWYDQSNLVIVPMLKESFERINRQTEYFDPRFCRKSLPPVLESFIAELRKEALELPIYQTDFQGVLVDGVIQTDPWPEHRAWTVHEADWKGGHHVNPRQIYAGQICDQGGSFGPICLNYLEDLTRWVFKPHPSKKTELSNN